MSETLHISNVIAVWAISVPKKLHIAFNEITYNKIQIAAVRVGANRNYSRALCLLKRDLNSVAFEEMCYVQLDFKLRISSLIL
jgi:hypothetical protein